MKHVKLSNSNVDTPGKKRLGWRYWPTVYFWTFVNNARAWWLSLWLLPFDDCAVCHGANGGIPGNENVIDGKLMCDYCLVKQLLNIGK